MQAKAAREGREKLIAMGYDPASFWEQQVVWGDHDSFQYVTISFSSGGRVTRRFRHVNNVRYGELYFDVHIP